MWGQIPDDELGGMRWIRLRVWTLTISADDPAKKSLTPFVESCSAHRHCNICTYHAKGAGAGRPLSFLRAPAEPPAKCARFDAVPQLRNEGQLLSLLRSLRSAGTAKDIKLAYDEHGINKLYYALEYYPHVKLLELPFDSLHLFPDGLLRSEGAWLFYVLGKLGLNLKNVDARVHEYRDLPRDVRIPPLHAKLTKGRKNGCPKSSAVLRMTGSQVMHFALHRYTWRAIRTIAIITPSHLRLSQRPSLSRVCAASRSSTLCSPTRCGSTRRGRAGWRWWSSGRSWCSMSSCWQMSSAWMICS